MPLGAAWISLLAALVWSSSMVVAKRGLADGGTVLQLAVVVAAVDAVSYWLVLVALRGTDALAALPAAAVGAFVLAGLVGTGVGRIASFAGIHRVGASINSAGISSRPLFATLLALVLLGEDVGAQVATGVVLLVAGVAVLSVSKGGDIGGWRPRDLLLPLGAAAAFALADVVRRFGFTTTPATALQGVTLNETAGAVVLAAYLLARRRGDLRVSRRVAGVFAASGLLNAVSLLLFFVALDVGPVAVASSLIATTPLFTTLLAYLFLGDLERVTRGVVAGGALVVVGAGLITAA